MTSCKLVSQSTAKKGTNANPGQGQEPGAAAVATGDRRLQDLGRAGLVRPGRLCGTHGNDCLAPGRVADGPGKDRRLAPEATDGSRPVAASLESDRDPDDRGRSAASQRRWAPRRGRHDRALLPRARRRARLPGRPGWRGDTRRGQNRRVLRRVQRDDGRPLVPRRACRSTTRWTSCEPTVGRSSIRKSSMPFWISTLRLIPSPPAPRRLIAIRKERSPVCLASLFFTVVRERSQALGF